LLYNPALAFMSQLIATPGVQFLEKFPDWQSAARLIDHTLLESDATRSEVIRFCEEAVAFGFASVFVHQSWAALAVSVTSGSGVKVGVPIGFPHGASLTTVKRMEAEEAFRLGASEIDMVLNIGRLKSGDRASVQADIVGVRQVVHANGGVLKVILETSLLTIDEKIVACQLSLAAGADFVKTSTGFAGGGATVDDIALMRGVVGDRMGVKASGGIRSAANALAMTNAGADRIGTSAGLEIIHELGAPINSARKSPIY
jgi:deoxyribose-phosphate aldolase